MPRIKTQPFRMCIVCRTRAEQHTLIRLQCEEKMLRPFSGNGRSFYLCKACVEDKKLDRALARQCKSGATQQLMSQLKEIISDDR
ncbi:MAG: DUF448 domain-containing protein [Campylobacterota bacterium]|nr:DUF448 domain-containing protein [Campylobacterota bacterium]